MAGPRLLLALAAVTALATRSIIAGIIATAPDSYTGVYIPGWAHKPWKPSAPDYFDVTTVNLDGVSHFYYAFLWIREIDSTVYDPFGSLSVMSVLKSKWPGVKYGLSIGGGGFDTKIWATAATTRLNAFVDSTIATMKSVDADAIDLDWEIPGAADRAAFTALCAALRSRLDAEGAAASPPRHYWLTAATQSILYGDSFAGYDMPALSTSLDVFNIMTYTMHDPCYWETTTNFHTTWILCAKALDYFISQGVPRTQLALGLAFYGHVYTLTDSSQYIHPAPSVESRDCSTMTTAYYRDIMRELQQNGGGVFTNTTERSAYYVRGTRWIGFDIAETLVMKIQGARDYGIGGVFIWDASLDLPDGALLRSVASRAMPPVRPCGGGFVGTGSCADPSQCCSEFGYCGIGEQFCGPRCRGGPCIPYPSPPPRPPAPPPSCGSGTVGSGTCADSSECCSKYGWCGTGQDWCGADCVGGPCNNAPRPPPSPPPRPSAPSPPPVPYGCGNGIVGNGTCLIANDCCSAFGWCANTPTHCGWGCKGGPCLLSPPPPGGYEVPICGDGVVGNGKCGFTGFCCSKFGYCGYTEEFCGAECQGGDCWFPPPAPGNQTLPPPPRASPSPSKMPPPPPSPKPPRSPKPPSKLLSPPSPRPPPPSPKPPPPPPKPKPPPPKPNPKPPPPLPRSPPKPPVRKPPPAKSPPPPSPKPPSPPPPPPVVATCGDGNTGNRICPDPTDCCTGAGFCGKGEDACYWFCVGGACWEPPPPPRQANVPEPPSPPPPAPGTVFCGNGVVGNGQCELKHMCCSAYGWCWYSPDHCGDACVGGPCWRPPPPPAARRALLQSNGSSPAP